MNNFDFQNPIVWVGPHYEYTGYGRMNRRNVIGLLDRGWNAKIEAMRCPIDIPKEEMKFFQSLLSSEKEKGIPIFMGKDVVKIVCWLPLKNIPKFFHNVIYTMMETRGVNQDFVNTCNEFYDSCWVPTSYYANVFEESGIKIPINTIPIGIDEIYSPLNIKDNLKLKYKVYYKNGLFPSDPFGYKFLSVFRWSYRKGFDVLIKSFLREFSSKDNVCLVISSKHASGIMDKRFTDAMENDILRLVEEHSLGNSAPIYWTKDNISYEDMPTLYSMSDCFCLASRGEGQALPPLEATRMGLPCIIPYHTGFTDYVSEKTCYQIDVDEWVVCNSIPEWNGWITRSFDNQEFPKFGEKTVEQVSALMRHVMNNPEEAKKKNKAFNDLIDEKYTWDKITNLIEERLNEVLKS